MGWGRRMVATVVVALAMVGAPTASATPQPSIDDSTIELLDEAMEALATGDVDRYFDIAAELDANHWLPEAGWDAIDDLDAEDLGLLTFLLRAEDTELLLFASDFVAMERDLLAYVNDVGVDRLTGGDIDRLDDIDEDGATVREIIEARAIDLPGDAGTALQILPDDALPPFDLSVYDRALDALTTRLDDLFLSGPTPFPDGPAPFDDVVGEVPADAGAAGGLIADPATPTDDAIAPPGMPDDPIGAPDLAAEDGLPVVDAAASSDPASVSDDAAGDAEAPATATPDAAPESSATDRDPVDMSSEPSPYPAVIGLGLAAIAALLVALVVVRRSHRRHDGLVAAAFTDGLTGLHNRRRFDDDLADESGNGERPTSVLMIDVDHFKQFNDAHGHAVGDDVLRRVGGIISATVRDVDLPYRYGGEEFSVLLPDTTIEEAVVVGERVRSAIGAARLTLPDGSSVSITASVGLSSGSATDVQQLVQLADRALYDAKEQGRNRLVHT